MIAYEREQRESLVLTCHFPPLQTPFGPRLELRARDSCRGALFAVPGRLSVLSMGVGVRLAHHQALIESPPMTGQTISHYRILELPDNLAQDHQCSNDLGRKRRPLPR